MWSRYFVMSELPLPIGVSYDELRIATVRELVAGVARIEMCNGVEDPN